MATIGDHEYRLRAIAYSPDGKRLASGAGDSTLRIRDAQDGQTILILDWEGADIADYIATMERLRALPVSAVHGGHDPSFGRDRLIEICDEYLKKWGAA